MKGDTRIRECGCVLETIAEYTRFRYEGVKVYCSIHSKAHNTGVYVTDNKNDSDRKILKEVPNVLPLMRCGKEPEHAAHVIMRPGDQRYLCEGNPVPCSQCRGIDGAHNIDCPRQGANPQTCHHNVVTAGITAQLTMYVTCTSCGSDLTLIDERLGKNYQPTSTPGLWVHLEKI